MIPLAWEELQALALGRLEGAPADGIVRRIHDDSREARPGGVRPATSATTGGR